MIFASTHLYSLAKKLGLEPASGEFMRQVHLVAEALAEQKHGPRDVGFAVLKTQPPPAVFIPAAYTIGRAALVDEIQINVNAGATVIAKARNLAAHEFIEGLGDVWLSVDDDVEVSAEALATMVAQCKAEPCIVVAPCLQRDTLGVNIEPSAVVLEARTLNGGRLERIKSGGFGCVAMSRAALELVIESGVWGAEARWWTHDDGIARRVLFRDEIDDQGRWHTEDRAFFLHVPASVPVYMVRTGRTVHSGQTLDLETLEAIVARKPYEPPSILGPFKS